MIPPLTRPSLDHGATLKRKPIALYMLRDGGLSKKFLLISLFDFDCDIDRCAMVDRYRDRYPLFGLRT